MTKNEKLDDSYELGPTLGRGTYSEVLRAKRKSSIDLQQIDSLDDASVACLSPDVVAIKRISKSKLITCEERLMPQREIEVHETIGRHPNAVYMFKSYEDAENVFLVLEMVDGGTLEEKLKRKPLGLPEDEAKKIIHQLLLAVQHLHDRNLVHVDISPKNILIDDKTGIVKLCDFGMTQVSRSTSSTSLGSNASSTDSSSGVFGTVGYAAPELCTGSPVDEKADMWSIGMVTYEILTGVSPYVILANGENISFPDELWGNLHKEALDFTQCLLQGNSCDRPSIGKALAHSWFCS